MPRLLANRYELGSLIGAGGTARVYVGHDTVLDRRVAIKILDDDAVASNDPARRARFLDEAKSGAQFTHHGAVAVYDAGESDGDLYIVMELVQGRSLAEMIAADAPLPEATAVSIAAQLLDALAATHAAGIVHRDVKPGNVLVDGSGTVKLADFGIAKRFDELAESLTTDGMVIGTRAYLAPEQAAGRAPTPAVDQYAVGVLLFEMLSGRRPPLADADATTGADVRTVRPDVCPPVAHAIARALAPRPELRFPGVADMAAWLRAEQAATTVVTPAAAAPGTTVRSGAPSRSAPTALLPRVGEPPPGSPASPRSAAVPTGPPEPRPTARRSRHPLVSPTTVQTTVHSRPAASPTTAGPAHRRPAGAGQAAHPLGRGASPPARRPSRPPATTPPSARRSPSRWAVPLGAVLVVLALVGIGVAVRDALPGPDGVDASPQDEVAPGGAAPEPAPSETAALPTTPPGSELIPGFPMTDDLDEFVDLLRESNDVAGKKSKQLGDRLRKVSDADPGDRVDDAADLLEDLDEWVADGQLDPTVADRARLFLAFLAPEAED